MKRVGIISALSTLLLAVFASTALAAIVLTVNFDNGPRGAHFVTGTPTPECTVESNQRVSCNSYEIAGVGNTNAVANLSATYTAVVDCFNPGVSNRNNPIESHETTFDVVQTSGLIEPKNGRLTVPALNVGPRPLSATEEASLCPNPSWKAIIRPGTIELVSFTYTVTFEGFTAPAIRITGP